MTLSDVRSALDSVDRNRFLPGKYKGLGDQEVAVPFADGITVPPKGITELVCGLLDLHPDDRVLEIGTGSGYQSAVLARLCAEVYTCDVVHVHPEIVERLPENVTVYSEKDGRYTFLWEKFDAVLVTAGTEKIYDFWEDVLEEGGRLVVPEGKEPNYEIRKYIKESGKLRDYGTFAYCSVVPIRRG